MEALPSELAGALAEAKVVETESSQSQSSEPEPPGPEMPAPVVEALSRAQAFRRATRGR
jgi:hypothetical protein